MLREQIDAPRAGRVVIAREQIPIGGGCYIDRSVEIVAKRCAERRLIAFGDADLFDNRGPAASRSVRKAVSPKSAPRSQDFAPGVPRPATARAFPPQCVRDSACAASAASISFSAVSAAAFRGLERCAEQVICDERIFDLGTQGSSSALTLASSASNCGISLRLVAEIFIQRIALRFNIRESALRAVPSAASDEASAVSAWGEFCARRGFGIRGHSRQTPPVLRLRHRAAPARRRHLRSELARGPRSAFICAMRRSSSAKRALARRSSPSRVSRASTNFCNSLPALASASRKGGNSCAVTACRRAVSA